MVVSISTTEKRKVIKEGSIGFLLNVGARAGVMFFQKISMFSLFKVIKSHQKAMSKVRTIVSAVNIIKMTLVEAKAL